MSRLTLVDIGSRMRPMEKRTWTKGEKKAAAPAKEAREPAREESSAQPPRAFAHTPAPIYKHSGRT